MTNLLALYRRPDGGDAAVETFEEAYTDTHLPLIARVPGLRRIHAQRVTRALTESDLFLVTAMEFEDRAALDAGLASDEMRAAARSLRDIGGTAISTLLIVEDAPDVVPEIGS